MKNILTARGEEAVAKVGFMYHLEIFEAKGKEGVWWTVDLKNGKGSIKEGKHGKADATLSLLDADAFALFQGNLNPQTAFMQGKMKIKGNMQAATKFNPELLQTELKK